MTVRGRRYALAGVLLVYLALATTYSLSTPLWEAPDEPHHFAYVQQLARGDGLPVLDPASPGPWRQEGGQPPLYYALAALLVRAVPGAGAEAPLWTNPHVGLGVAALDGNANYAVHTADEGWPFRGAALAAHLVRLLSVLLGAVTVLSGYLLARELFAEQHLLALVAAALTAASPMFLFVSGAITNDALAIALCSLMLWRLTRALRLPPDLPGWLTIGVLLGLAALSKLSALALTLPVALVALLLAVRDGRRHLWLAALGVVLPVLAIAGWWFGRNWRLYGDLTGLEPFVAIIGKRYPVPTLLQLWGERQGLVRSYLGLFGWMNVPAPEWVYGVLGGALAVGLLAAPFGLWRLKRSGSLTTVMAWQWGLIALWPVTLLVLLVRWTLMTPATQGRLLFPALTCVNLWVALGCGAVVRGRARRWVAGGLVAVWLAAAVAMPWAVIAPAYRPPAPITRAALPATARPIDAAMGGGVRLLAVELPATSVTPGEPLRLTLYWQAEAAPAQDYSVYLHLVGAEERIVAQRDRYPVGGLLPTSLWAPGAIYADAWAVELPATLWTPETLQVRLGLYDHRDGSRPGEAMALGALEAQARQPAGLPNEMSVHFGERIALAGYDLDRVAARPGEELTLTLYWRALRDGRENLSVFCQVRDGQGNRWAQHDGWPQDGERPTAGWRKGDLIVDTHVLTVADDAAEGVWGLYVGLYDQGGHRLTVLGEQGQAVAREVQLTPIRVLPK